MKFTIRNYKEPCYSKLKGKIQIESTKGYPQFEVERKNEHRNVGTFDWGKRRGGSGGTAGADRQSGAFRCLVRTL